MLLENTSENPSNSPILDPGFTQGVLSNGPCLSVGPSISSPSQRPFISFF